jgi:hypothetical protein
MKREEAREVALIAASLAGILLLAYVRPLLLGDTFVLRDHLSYGLPARAHLVESIREGRFPEWWDAIGLGVPFASNPNHGALYPPAWLIALFPPSFGSDLFLLSHLWVAGFGTAMLSRRLGAPRAGALVGGSAVMLGGYASSVLVNHMTLLSLAWVTWVAWAADRVAGAKGAAGRARSAVALAVFVALLLLSGEPTAAIVGAWLVLLFALSRSTDRATLVAIGTALVLGAGLASVGLVPAVALLRDSNRAAGLSGDQGNVWSLHPWALPELVWPDVLGDPTGASLSRLLADTGGAGGLSASWALSVYVGGPSLLLAAFGARSLGRRAPWFLLAAAAFVVIALGRNTPVYALYRTVFLPEHVLRYPAKYLVGALVLVGVLAGVGWRSLGEAGPARSMRVASWTFAAGLALAVGLAFAGRATLTEALEARAAAAGVHVDVSAALGAATEAGARAVAGLLAFAAAQELSRREAMRALAAAFAGVVIVGDLVVRVWQLQPLAPRSAFGHLPALLAGVNPRSEGPGIRPRLYRSRRLMPVTDSSDPGAITEALYDSAFENTPARWGFDAFPGYLAARSAHMERLEHAVEHGGQGGRILALFDVGYAVLDADSARASGMPVLAATPAGDIALVENARRRPRAFVASCSRQFAGEDDLFHDLLTGDPAPGRVRLLGDPASSVEGERCVLTPCAVEAPRPEQVMLACSSASGGWAVLLDAFAPGWSATVDGAPAQVSLADGIARAVRLPPGAHAVSFSYRTPGLTLGTLLTLVSAALGGLAYAYARRQTASTDLPIR